MKKKPLGREILFDLLQNRAAAERGSLETRFILIRGNPGTGKTFTEETIPKAFPQPVIIFDEVDYYLLQKRALMLEALFKLRNSKRKLKQLVILVCNDLTARTTELLAPFGPEMIEVQDYTEAQLLLIAKELPELQNAIGNVPISIVVKRAVETGKGDCRVLFNKVKQLNENEALTVAAATKIDQAKDLLLSYGEAYCLKSIYALKQRCLQSTLKTKRRVLIGYDVDRIVSQLEHQYEDPLYIQQFLEHLETKELIERHDNLVVLREAGDSVLTRRVVEEMTA